MRICVVTQSEAFASSAGMRIRYDRLAAGAAALGAEISAVPIGSLRSKSDLAHDVYLFAKTYSAHAFVLAHRMRELGKRTGIDIFDDYFTQRSDTRLRQYRTWLRTMGGLIDFALCSTPRLEGVLNRLLPAVPVAVIADPSQAYDPRRVAFFAGRKSAEAQETRHLRVLWFGIGDNPYFPVGIRDLVAFGGELSRLNRRGWSAELTVLTNLRALTPDGLNLLRRLPIPYAIEEWTPEREVAALERHHVCFLPVNGQDFSRMKSLNRAVTALVAGCQVLAVGYPLYEPLADLLYGAPEALLADLAENKPALRAETMPVLTERLSALADPYQGANTFASFLHHLSTASDTAQPSIGTPTNGHLSRNILRTLVKTGFYSNIGIINGAFSDSNAHKSAQTFGGLSVKSHFCRERFNFDVRFDFFEDTGETNILIAEQAVEFLTDDLRGSLVPFGRILDRTFYRLLATRTPVSFRRNLLRDPTRMKEIAAATELMPSLIATCRHLFPHVTFYVSERSALLAQDQEAAA